jgi:hypothetical protein
VPSGAGLERRAGRQGTDANADTIAGAKGTATAFRSGLLQLRFFLFSTRLADPVD